MSSGKAAMKEGIRVVAMSSVPFIVIAGLSVSFYLTVFEPGPDPMTLADYISDFALSFVANLALMIVGVFILGWILVPVEHCQGGCYFFFVRF